MYMERNIVSVFNEYKNVKPSIILCPPNSIDPKKLKVAVTKINHLNLKSLIVTRYSIMYPE